MGRRVWVPVVSGPLAPYAAEFASWLASRGYSPEAAANRLYQFDQLSRWLEREGLGVGELTGEQAERFAATRRAAGLVTWVAPQSAMLPLGYLRSRRGCCWRAGTARKGWGWSGSPRQT